MLQHFDFFFICEHRIFASKNWTGRKSPDHAGCALTRRSTTGLATMALCETRERGCAAGFALQSVLSDLGFQAEMEVFV